MSIILKHIFRNIKSNKVVSTLIIISAAVSAALLFVTLSLSGVETEYEAFSTVFFLIFFASCGMSIFIIYSGYRVIVNGRLNVLGIFRSLGVTKRKSNLIMTGEILLYGIISGASALIIGTALLAAIMKFLVSEASGLKFSVINALTTIVFSIGISLLCALFPIRAAAKTPLKDIILGSYSVKTKKYFRRFAAGAVMITAGLVIPLPAFLKYNMIIVILSLLLVFTGIVCMVPWLSQATGKLIEKIFPQRIAPKNLRKNKNYISIVTLLTIGISVIALINNSYAFMMKATDEAFALSDYQIEARGPDLDSLLEEQLNGIDGVEKAGGIYYKNDVKVQGKDNLANLYAMKQEKFEAFFKFTINGRAAEPVFSDLEARGERRILLSADYLARCSLKTGSKLVLTAASGGCEYTVAGEINEMLNSGNIGVVSEYNFSADFNPACYSYIAIKTGMAAGPAIAGIAAALPGDRQISLTALIDHQQKIMDMNADIFTVLRLLSVLSAAIGAVGIVNNLIINFMQREKTMAVLRSIGVSSGGSAGMIAGEALITGAAGGIMGALGGLCLSQSIPAVLRVFEFPVTPIAFDLLSFLMFAGAGIVICLAAGLPIIFKARKMNIIKSLKVIAD